MSSLLLSCILTGPSFLNPNSVSIKLIEFYEFATETAAINSAYVELVAQRIHLVSCGSSLDVY